MSERKINLEEILAKSFGDCGIPKPTHTLAEITQRAVREAMKEACRQTLELAAENAKLIDVKTKRCDDHTPYYGVC